MPSLATLPDEIIHLIASSRVLRNRDRVNLALTCKPIKRAVYGENTDALNAINPRSGQYLYCMSEIGDSVANLKRLLKDPRLDFVDENGAPWGDWEILEYAASKDRSELLHALFEYLDEKEIPISGDTFTRVFQAAAGIDPRKASQSMRVLLSRWEATKVSPRFWGSVAFALACGSIYPCPVQLRFVLQKFEVDFHGLAGEALGCAVGRHDLSMVEVLLECPDLTEKDLSHYRLRVLEQTMREGLYEIFCALVKDDRMRHRREVWAKIWDIARENEASHDDNRWVNTLNNTIPWDERNERYRDTDDTDTAASVPRF